MSRSVTIPIRAGTLLPAIAALLLALHLVRRARNQQYADGYADGVSYQHRPS